jgi:hypothetical protein
MVFMPESPYALIMVRGAGTGTVFINKEGSQRCYILNLMTGILEPAGFMPYAAPTAYGGHRAVYVKTPDGVMWIYLLRSSGQELFRVPLEWPI